MSHITGGSVTYSRRHNLGDYNHKDVACVMAFSYDEGDNEATMLKALDRAGLIAYSKVEELITGKNPVVGLAETAETRPPRGARKPPTVPLPASVGSEQEASEALAANTNAAGVTQGMGATEVVERVAEQAAISTGEERKDPANPEPVADEWDVTTAAAALISDLELTNRVTARNKAINNAPLIKTLIGKFAGPAPKGLRDVPQEQRATFLSELDVLQ